MTTEKYFHGFCVLYLYMNGWMGLNASFLMGMARGFKNSILMENRLLCLGI